MTEQSAHQRYEFKKKLESLRDKKGRSTELITLYIPLDKQIFDVTNQLKEEHGQAANIKSKLTRTNVQGAIESLLSRLKYLDKVPGNGIVYFTGAVDIGANKTNMESEVIIPPEPITAYKYHCNSTFYLEPLEDMLKDKNTFGLLVLDRREATVGLLVGKRIQAFRHLTSTVPGKQRKGGQSAHRFQHPAQAESSAMTRRPTRNSGANVHVPRGSVRPAHRTKKRGPHATRHQGASHRA